MARTSILSVNISMYLFYIKHFVENSESRLLLGDFAVQIGWFSPDVIFYMAIESIAGFTQSNYELGYAFNFIRMLCLVLIALFNYWGLILGTLIGLILIVTNETVLGTKTYLYPLIPFDGKKLSSLLIRKKLSKNNN